MKKNKLINFKNKIKRKVFDKNGNLERVENYENLVLNAGPKIIADCLAYIGLDELPTFTSNTEDGYTVSAQHGTVANAYSPINSTPYYMTWNSGWWQIYHSDGIICDGVSFTTDVWVTYEIQVSDDGSNFTNIATGGATTSESLTFPTVKYKYIRFYFPSAASNFTINSIGMSIKAKGLRRIQFGDGTTAVDGSQTGLQGSAIGTTNSGYATLSDQVTIDLESESNFSQSDGSNVYDQLVFNYRFDNDSGGLVTVKENVLYTWDNQSLEAFSRWLSDTPVSNGGFFIDIYTVQVDITGSNGASVLFNELANEIIIKSLLYGNKEYLLSSYGLGSNEDKISIVPAMTDYTVPAPFAISSNANLAGRLPWEAFDSAPGDYWGSSSSTGWLKVDMGAATLIAGYYITVTALTDRTPNTWILEGSNNDADWTTIDSQSSITWNASETKNFTLASSETYRYYRLNISVSNGTNTYIVDMNFIGGFSDANKLNGAFQIAEQDSIVKNGDNQLLLSLDYTNGTGEDKNIREISLMAQYPFPALTSNSSNPLGNAFDTGFSADSWQMFNHNQAQSTYNPNTGGFVGFMFDEIHYLGALWADFNSVIASTYDIEISLDTTNGTDGTWETVYSGVQSNVGFTIPLGIRCKAFRVISTGGFIYPSDFRPLVCDLFAKQTETKLLTNTSSWQSIRKLIINT